MRTGFFVLPFIALFIGAFSTAIASAFPTMKWILYSGWLSAAIVVLLWVVLDFEAFRAFFARKGAKYGASSGLTLVLGILVIVGAAILTSKPRFNKSYDATRSGLNTLSDQSVKAILNVKDKGMELSVRAFFRAQNDEQQFRDLMALYSARADVFRVQYIDTQVDPDIAEASGVTADTVIFQHRDQEARITTFNEEKITNAIIHVLKDGKKKIYFTTGHGEPQLGGAENQFEQFTKALEEYRYEVSSLDIMREAGIPEDAEAVVMAAMRYDIKPEEAKFIDAYLQQGGSLLLLLGPMVRVDRLNNVISKYGIKFNNDYIVTMPGDTTYGRTSAFITDFDEFNPVTKDFGATGLNIRAVQLRSLAKVEGATQMKVELVAKTMPNMTRYRNVLSQAQLKAAQSRERETAWDNLELAAFPVVGVASGRLGTAPGSAQDAGDGPSSSSKKETRIVAIGSSVMAYNEAIQVYPEGKDLLVNSVNYLLKDEDFISIRPRKSEKSSIDLSTGQSQLSLMFIAFIYPFLFLGVGACSWLIRRRA